MSKKNLTSQQTEKHLKKTRSNSKQRRFGCECGKLYGSLAAVHTHINLKHPHHKKTYKNLIYNPDRKGQIPNSCIRLRDIQYPEKQVDLMCLSENTIHRIYEYIKLAYSKTNKDYNILLNDDDYNSDQESQDQDSQAIEQRELRDRNVQEQVTKLKQQFSLAELHQTEPEFIEFKPFKQEKFTLNIVKELIKFLKVPFAAKIQLQIYMTAVRKRNISSGLKELMQECEMKIWDDDKIIPKQIENYYNAWIDIVNRPNLTLQ